MENAARACVYGLPGWSFLSSQPPDPADPIDSVLLFAMLSRARDLDEERADRFAVRIANEVAKRFG